MQNKDFQIILDHVKDPRNAAAQQEFALRSMDIVSENVSAIGGLTLNSIAESQINLTNIGFVELAKAKVISFLSKFKSAEV